MDLFLQRVYVGEIKTQCQFAINAVGALNHALRQLGSFRPDGQAERQFFHAEVFRQTHSFLTHASNVSRLFWPPVPKQRSSEADAAYQARIGSLDKVQRASCLRDLYKLEDDNCLRNRTLRDHLEHYDERLDHWRQTSEHRNIASDTIGPPNSIIGLTATDLMRWFDPSSNSFRFRGEEYNLQELATAIDRLLPMSVQLEEELWARQIAGA
jgi:hypothetical protein